MLSDMRAWWRGDGIAQRVLRASGPSLGEIVFTFAVSNIAVFALLTLWALSNDPGDVDPTKAWAVVTSSIRPSEVLVYVMATLAAPLWLMFTRWRAKKHVALFSTMLIVQALIVLISALVFSVATLGRLKNTGLASDLALACFVLSVLIWFVTLIYVRVWVDPAVETPRPGPSALTGDSVLERLKQRGHHAD